MYIYMCALQAKFVKLQKLRILMNIYGQNFEIHALSKWQFLLNYR